LEFQRDVIAVQCRYCNRKDRLVKVGVRHTSKGTVQKYLCRRCKKYSSSSLHTHGLYPDEIILRALNLFNHGISVESISLKIQEEFSRKPPVRTIYSWMERYERRYGLYILRGMRDDNCPDPIVSIWSDKNRLISLKYHRYKYNVLSSQFPGLVEYIEGLDEKDIRGSLTANEYNEFDMDTKEFGFERDNKGSIEVLELVHKVFRNMDDDRLKDFLLLNGMNYVIRDLPLIIGAEELDSKENRFGIVDIVSIQDRTIQLIHFADDDQMPADLLSRCIHSMSSFSKITGIDEKKIHSVIMKDRVSFRVKHN